MRNLLLVLLCATVTPCALLAQTKLDVQPSDTIAAILQRNVGQVVELRMKSGEKIGGKVEKVGDKLVQLSQLTGAEFYDGVVDVADISAVVARKSK